MRCVGYKTDGLHQVCRKIRQLRDICCVALLERDIFSTTCKTKSSENGSIVVDDETILRRIEMQFLRMSLKVSLRMNIRSICSPLTVDRSFTYSQTLVEKQIYHFFTYTIDSRTRCVRAINFALPNNLRRWRPTRDFERYRDEGLWTLYTWEAKWWWIGKWLDWFRCQSGPLLSSLGNLSSMILRVICWVISNAVVMMLVVLMLVAQVCEDPDLDHLIA